MASVSVNGITIEYDVRGDGEPLLLVMGLGGQLTDWPDDFVDVLVEAGFKVIRLDNRDAGLSGGFEAPPPSLSQLVMATVARRPPPAEYLLADMADDAAGLLAALDVDSAHVVGASMGGMIAQSLAIGHPERVRTLTSIMSTTGDRRNGRPTPRVMATFARLRRPSRDGALERSVKIARLVSGPDFDEPAYRRLAEANIARSWRPEGTGRQTAAIMASPDRTKALGKVTAPTLVVHGLLDPLVQPSGGIATARAVPGSRLVMYPEMGHNLPRRRWPELVAALKRNAERAS